MAIPFWLKIVIVIDLIMADKETKNTPREHAKHADCSPFLSFHLSI